MGPPPVTATFSISALSQDAGRLASGRAVTATAAGIVGNPTILSVTPTNAGGNGSIGSVTGSSFVWTTPTFSASGTYLVTIQNGNGQTSAFGYTALPAPVLTLISPIHGPATIAQPTITVMCSGLPPAGSGCPVTFALGTGTGTLTPTGPGIGTCPDMTAVGTGAVTGTITVDGVSTGATSGLYTGDAAPTVTSSLGAGSSGGTGSLFGTGFVSGATISVLINGTPTALTPAFVSSTKLNYVLPNGSYTTGTWTATVTNPDNQTGSGAVFEITSSASPAVLFGSALLCWVRSDLVVGSPVTQWTDKSGNGNHLTASTTARPTFNASSANFNGQPSLTFDGVANTMVSSSFALGTNTIVMYAVCRPLTTGTNIICRYSAGAQLQVNGATSLSLAYGTTLTYTKGSTVIASQVVRGIVVGTGASTENQFLAVNNVAEVNNTGAVSQPSGSSAFRLGANQVPSGFENMEIVEAVFANARLSAPDEARLQAYFNGLYQLEPISFTSATNVTNLTAGATGRISGSGFNATTSVSVPGQGAVVTTFINATTLDVSYSSMAAGSYSIQIDNANSGASFIQTNALTVTATDDVMSIVGTKCVLWNRADQVVAASPPIANGGAVLSFSDLALLGQFYTQPTGANQPTYQAVDAVLSNRPSVHFVGASNQRMDISALKFDTGANSFWVLMVVNQTVAAATVAQTFNSGNDNLQFQANGLPKVQLGGANITTWAGSSILNSKTFLYWASIATGAGTENCLLNVNFGTEQSVATNKANPATNQPTHLAWNGAGSPITGFIAEIIICDSQPTGPQQTRLAAYLAARYP